MTIQNKTDIKSTSMSKIVTIFKNIKETNAPFHKEIGFVLERIRNGASQELVRKIRGEKKKHDRNELKKQLPSICFSGKFAKRGMTPSSSIAASSALTLTITRTPSQCLQTDRHSCVTAMCIAYSQAHQAMA